MKDFWKRKRNKRIAASALAVVMAGFLVWGLFPWQAAAAGTTVADDVTINKWHDPEALDDSTKNVGRIWTDKSVSTGDVDVDKAGPDSGTDWNKISPGRKRRFHVPGRIVRIVLNSQDHGTDDSAPRYRAGAGRVWAVWMIPVADTVETV